MSGPDTAAPDPHSHDQIPPIARLLIVADARLDSVLSHMRQIGARASGTTGDDSIMAALADAVTQFQPDQI